jgi:hypothetical protein
VRLQRYTGNAWRGWWVQVRRLNVDYKMGITHHDRILTFTWDGRK